jgi:hypothetical protein
VWVHVGWHGAVTCSVTGLGVMLISMSHYMGVGGDMPPGLVKHAAPCAIVLPCYMSCDRHRGLGSMPQHEPKVLWRQCLYQLVYHTAAPIGVDQPGGP